MTIDPESLAQGIDHLKSGEELCSSDQVPIADVDGALHLLETIADRSGQTDQRDVAEAHTVLAVIASSKGNKEASLTGFERSLHIWRELGDREKEAEVLFRITNLRIDGADVTFLERIEEEITVHRELGNPSKLAHTLTYLVRNLDASSERALAANEEALSIYTEIGEMREAAGVRQIMARNYLDRDEIPLCVASIKEALRLARQLGDLKLEIAVLFNFAAFIGSAGDREGAKARYLEIIAIARADESSEAREAEKDALERLREIEDLGNIEAKAAVLRNFQENPYPAGGQLDLLVELSFDWGGGVFLRAGNERARQFFDEDEKDILLVESFIERAWSLEDWYDGALNWESPKDSGSWSQAERDEFNKAVESFIEELESEWAGTGVHFRFGG